MDRFWGFFTTPFFADGVQRVNMVFLENGTNTTTKILRVWPCQKILNASLMMDDIQEGCHIFLFLLKKLFFFKKKRELGNIIHLRELC